MELLEALDQGAVHPFRHVGQVEALKPVLVGLWYIGHPFVLLVVVLLAGWYFTRRGEKRTATLLGVTLALAMGLSLCGQMLVERARPNVEWTPVEEPLSNSFPSLQALGGAAVYGALGVLLSRRLKRRWPLFLGLLLALLAGASQLLVGHNFLTDVFAGWLAGGALAALCVNLDASGPGATARESSSSL